MPIRARCPHIDALAGHVTAFAEMMTARTGSRDLETWLAAVEADEHAGLRSLAAGIRNDQQAVINGLTLHWNSGKVEGTASKIIMWNLICQAMQVERALGSLAHWLAGS
jgi:transposase